MIKQLLICVAIILNFAPMAYAQQIANSSHLGQTRAIWNPAYTAHGSNMIFDGFMRGQWLGFNGAPISGFISGQIPFPDYNMSAGALLLFDRTGPISKIGLQLNYAYHIPKAITKHGQLSLGLAGNVQQYAFNPQNETVRDPNDPYLTLSSSTFFPTLSAGFFYTSDIREFKKNSLFVGAAFNQLLASDVFVNDFNQERRNHVHLNIGGKIYSFNSYFEPMITANIVKPDILDVLYSLRYEMNQTFWAGVGYSGSGFAAIQGGVYVPYQDNLIKIGVLANYGFLASKRDLGPSLEFYIGYIIKK